MEQVKGKCSSVRADCANPRREKSDERAQIVSTDLCLTYFSNL